MRLDKPVVILDPASQEPAYPKAGSTTCVSCGSWCWLSPASLQAISDGSVYPLCQPCGITLIKDDSNYMGRVEDL